MTISAAYNIWVANMQYRVSREKYYAPKIFSNLKDIIASVAQADSVQNAIGSLDRIVTIDKLAGTIQGIYVDAGRVMGGRAYQQVRKTIVQKSAMPMGYNEQLVNEIIDYFQLNLLNKAVLPVTETMKAWLMDRLITGQQNGDSLAEIVRDMIAQDFPKNRAQVITRTEVLRAANYGSMAGAKKSGFKLTKTWISAQDNRTRRIPRDQYSHLSMNGITIGIDESFQVPKKSGGYETLMFPGDPAGSAADVIQCRCTLGYEPLRDANGLPIET